MEYVSKHGPNKLEKSICSPYVLLHMIWSSREIAPVLKSLFSSLFRKGTAAPVCSGKLVVYTGIRAERLQILLITNHLTHVNPDQTKLETKTGFWVLEQLSFSFFFSFLLNGSSCRALLIYSLVFMV